MILDIIKAALHLVGATDGLLAYMKQPYYKPLPACQPGCDRV